VKSKTLVTLSLLVFVFLLGFSFSVQTYALRQQELNSPVNQYLRESYGVNSVEEYEAKLEQEAWLNYSRQMEALASENPDLNLTQWQIPYRQAGTSAYQPPTLKSEQPFYAVVLGEPVVALQVFSLSGLGLLGLTAIPPVKKHKQLKEALILGIVVLCIFSVGYFTGYTVAQTGTITIEPNSFQTEASYVIFTDGTTIKARNGATGAIDYSGTNASAVIQSAINALTSGGKIFIKAGTYLINSTLYLGNNLVLAGEGIDATVLKLADGANVDIIQNANFGVRNNYNIVVTDLTLDGNRANNPSAGNGIYGAFARSLFFNLKIQNCPNYAIRLTGFATGDAGRSYNTYISHSVIQSNVNGVRFEIGTTGVGACDNYVHYNIFARNGNNQIEVYQVSDIEIIGNHFFSAGQGLGLALGVAVYGWSSDIRVISNTFENLDKEAILFDATNNYISNSLIIGNNIWDVGKATNNTYDAIYLKDWKCRYNIVALNRIRVYQATNKYRYAINDDNTGGNTAPNVIIGNYLSSGATGTLRVATLHRYIKRNVGYITENGGTATFSGTGSQTQFTIAHGLAGTPKMAIVTAGSSDAKGDFYVTYDATNLTVTYATAPPSGTNNVVLNWYAEV
jgi:hypothetical protein